MGWGCSLWPLGGLFPQRKRLRAFLFPDGTHHFQISHTSSVLVIWATQAALSPPFLPGILQDRWHSSLEPAPISGVKAMKVVAPQPRDGTLLAVSYNCLPYALDGLARLPCDPSQEKLCLEPVSQSL